MLKNPEAQTLIQDARAMQADGERLLAVGDWRDAAEKGWLAVRNATAALILEVTGVPNRSSTQINAGIRKLAQDRGGQYADLRRRYTDAVYHLHAQAFYNGLYHDDIPSLVRETADYIQRAEHLAAPPPQSP